MSLFFEFSPAAPGAEPERVQVPREVEAKGTEALEKFYHEQLALRSPEGVSDVVDQAAN